MDDPVTVRLLAVDDVENNLVALLGAPSTAARRRQGAARFGRRYPMSSSLATFLCSPCQPESSRSV